MRGEVDVQVAEVFARDHVEGETYPFDGEQLDLAALVRDAVTLELPFAPGPPVDADDRCTICGRDAPGADDDDADDEPARDPRWAALDDLDLDE